MENAQEQPKKQFDWLKGYEFVKGVSGNPGGRPKGSKSLKTFAREYLETLPEEQKIKFLESLPSELIWKMAEGNPKQDTDITSGGKELPQPIIHVHTDNSNEQDTKAQ